MAYISFLFYSLVTLLARDLQDVFYQDFHAVFKSILSLLSLNDAKLYEV